MGPLSPVPYVDPELIRRAILAQLSDEDSEAPAQQKSKRPIRVIVVDDHARIADTTAELLEQAGFETRAAYSGEIALKLAESFAPDCLLTDVVMPGMHGVALAETFRDRHPQTRVVLMSGQVGLSPILEEAERRGLEFELLAKPIHPAELIRYLETTPRR